MFASCTLCITLCSHDSLYVQLGVRLISFICHFIFVWFTVWTISYSPDAFFIHLVFVGSTLCTRKEIIYRSPVDSPHNGSIMWKTFRFRDVTMNWLVEKHYSDVIMSTMGSQIISRLFTLETAYSGADQRKHQSPALLAFVRGIPRWPVNSPHKGPEHGKCFHLRTSSWMTRPFPDWQQGIIIPAEFLAPELILWTRANSISAITQFSVVTAQTRLNLCRVASMWPMSAQFWHG